MIWNHNTTPPTVLPDRGSVEINGTRVAWSANTPDASLAALGLYRPGTDDLIPPGHRVVSQERVLRDGRSVLVRVTEPAPVVEPVPQEFPDGIETPAIVFPQSSAHDWLFEVIDGTPVAVQISASPRVDGKEQAARMRAKKETLDSVRASLPDLLKSNSVADLREAVRQIAAILNLTA